jgi:hypothetical protein
MDTWRMLLDVHVDVDGQSILVTMQNFTRRIMLLKVFELIAFLLPSDRISTMLARCVQASSLNNQGTVVETGEPGNVERASCQRGVRSQLKTHTGHPGLPKVERDIQGQDPSYHASAFSSLV